jgi:hypothetical protein
VESVLTYLDLLLTHCCPISSYLFTIIAEILGIAIRRSDEVKGFKYKNAESKLSQYADDTQIIIDGSA